MNGYNQNEGGKGPATGHKVEEIVKEKMRATDRRVGAQEDIIAYNVKTHEIRRFRSQEEASKETGVKQENISTSLNTLTKNNHGTWQFYTEDATKEIEFIFSSRKAKKSKEGKWLLNADEQVKKLTGMTIKERFKKFYDAI